MSLLVSTLNDNKSLSTSERAVCVFSDETTDLDLSERSQGRFIDVIKPAHDERIKQARIKDLNLGVFVAHNGGVMV
jgi:hypothetical protein